MYRLSVYFENLKFSSFQSCLIVKYTKIINFFSCLFNEMECCTVYHVKIDMHHVYRGLLCRTNNAKCRDHFVVVFFIWSEKRQLDF